MKANNTYTKEDAQVVAHLTLVIEKMDIEMECIREEIVCCNKAIQRIELYEGDIEDALIDSLENPYRFQYTNYLAKKDELLDFQEKLHMQSEIYKNLYFVGAGTHPGAGMPGVLSSAKVLDNLF